MNWEIAEHRTAYSLVARLHRCGTLRELVTLRDSLVGEKPDEDPRLKNRRQFLKLLLDDDVLTAMHRSLRDLRKCLPIGSSECKTQPYQDQKLYLSSKDPKEEREMHRQLRPVPLARRRPGYQLPVGQRYKEVSDIIENNTYSLIAADAGSGKSTQIPQILLDNAISTGSGSKCRIICVQPRRIAAVSLAHRVAEERGQQVGHDVGYRVRFQSRYSSRGRTIKYCTTEHFLNLLHNQPTFLDSATHIILDEVHERDVALDLLMLTVKKMIKQRQATGAPVPKVTAMSATLDAGLFSSYFQNQSDNGTLSPAPCLRIPGRTFPVDKHYLDEIFEPLSQTYSAETLWSLYGEPSTRRFLAQHDFHLEASTEEYTQATVKMPSSPEVTSRDWDDTVPIGLICAVVGHILSTTSGGSILVFLPGLRHITGVEKALRMYGELLGRDFTDTRRYRILPLHSSLPKSQDQAFEMGPPGCRRIILSTDIAETSVTLPDVRFVVDTGKVNMSIYEPRERSSHLTCCWASQSSVAQRAGRAGRVQSGEYFALFTKEMYDTFRITRLPEIRRADLRRACLQVKKAGFGTSIQDTLQEGIEPPDKRHVDGAIQDLKLLDALGEREELTVLGNAIASLPIGPTQAKLVLLGIIFRCLEPLLIMAVLPGNGSLFYSTEDVEKQQQIRQAREDFSQNTWSDHLSAVNAYIAVRDELHQSGRSEAFKFALSKGICFDRFSEMNSAAHQVLRRLVSEGLIPQSSMRYLRFGGRALNVNSHRVPLIKALLFHTLHTNIAAPHLDLSGRYRTKTTGRVLVASSSVNGRTRPTSLLVFDASSVPSSGGSISFLCNTSHITPLIACLLGGRLQGTDETVYLDSWLALEVENSGGLMGNHAVKLLIELRKALEVAITTALDALVRRERWSHAVSPKAGGHIFRTVSKALVDVLDLDSDLVYDQRQKDASR
ncbi:P-loop containing nucleoside triphosphate hydrolase protein [Aspergillus steynii IBT 23096]|uniref:P-loop containing nucleoside triphosphate hydrolase protein n=1 Tax=Aspergillus steynii IBT 23096 TaxID=1392250 RepID=A0A2I2GCD7_9EURO|nr:P-loop containing nucleoside triphosphate hydrolase protein [Aspergillus steynii IBT 23096]PLB50548.1 P-loop containing nucleoside triphosphate hydrolase protein [Aspergillus steynii IBT 23096]